MNVKVHHLKSCWLAAVLAMQTQFPSAGAVKIFFVCVCVLPCDLLTIRPEVVIDGFVINLKHNAKFSQNILYSSCK